MAINKNYTGSFILNDNERYQAILASQNYGTFYVIYAKINFKKREINGEKVDVLDNIDLKLFNYKGLINLGFLDHEGRGVKITFDKEKGKLKLRVKIKGLQADDRTVKVYGDDEEPIKYQDIKQIYVDRKLLRLTESDREYRGVYDTEYFYRSGEDFHERRRSRGTDPHPPTEDKAFNGNCEESTLMVFSKP
ncbi:hypothetical protein [uncultured Tenacibaculum sp.]|uniref:hypothetical protein n=1 Tax=uncultured Tenacibaculum sp. TaxID=174713 RepID=UPI00262D56AD|nr:hypothetical protein [uncultured Tenacibaculum sp.]